MFRTAASFFVYGIVFGSTACLASCGPLVVSYVAGAKKNIPGSLLAYLAFSAARISVYLVLGLAFFLLGEGMLLQKAGDFSRYLYVAGGLFMILVGAGLSFAKPMRHLACSNAGASSLGVMAGILPCLPLFAMFSYIGLISKSWFSNVTYTLSFGIGTAVSPLLGLVFLAGFIPRVFKGAAARYQEIFGLICGLIIVILGIRLIMRAF